MVGPVRQGLLESEAHLRTLPLPLPLKVAPTYTHLLRATWTGPPAAGSRRAASGPGPARSGAPVCGGEEVCEGEIVSALRTAGKRCGGRPGVK